MYDDGNSVFRAKKQYLYSIIWEFGANGVKGSKFLVKNVIFGMDDPDFLIHYATFMELHCKRKTLNTILIRYSRSHFVLICSSYAPVSSFQYQKSRH